jgi:hypothetical protein
MSSERFTVWKAVPGPTRERAKPDDETPAKGVKVLSLDLDDEDSGGDPYNHTGQFYIDALRKREQSEE